MNKVQLMLGFILFCFGSFILGIAISCFIVSGLGSDAMSTFAQGIGQQFLISQGSANAIISFIMVSFAFVVDKKQIGIGTVIQPFICSYAIQLGLKVLPNMSGILLYLIYFIGLLLMGISIGITSKTNYGKTPYDSLIFALMNKFNKKYRVIRWIEDLIMLVVGIMLGGKYGIGTIITLLFVGIIAMFVMNYIEIKYFTKKLVY